MDTQRDTQGNIQNSDRRPVSDEELRELVKNAIAEIIARDEERTRAKGPLPWYLELQQEEAAAQAREDAAQRELMEHLPAWAQIGKTVCVARVVQEGRSVPVPIGTAGTVERYERGLIWVVFPKHLLAGAGLLWVQILFQEQREVSIGYHLEDLEASTGNTQARETRETRETIDNPNDPEDYGSN